jgi:hypothetical protein
MPIRTRVEYLIVLLASGINSHRFQSRTKLVFCFLESYEAFFLLLLSSRSRDLPFCLTLFAGSSRLEAAGRFLPILIRLELVVLVDF